MNNIPKTGRVCDDVLIMSDLIDVARDEETQKALCSEEFTPAEMEIDRVLYGVKYEGHALNNCISHNGWQEKLADVKLGKRMGEIFGELEPIWEERDENMPEDEWEALQSAPAPVKKLCQDFGMGRHYANSETAWGGFTYTR